MENDWIVLNKAKSNLPTETGDYFVWSGMKIHLVYVAMNEAYGLNFIESHGTHYMKVIYPEPPI